MRRWVTLVLVTMLGCGGSDPAPGSSTTANETPRTGGPAGPSGLQTHRDAIVALVKAAGATVDLAQLEREPFVVAALNVDDAARTYTANVAVSVVNAGSSDMTSVDFVMPIADGPANASRARIGAVTIDGKPGNVPVNPDLWSVPVAIAPGGRTTITFELSGALAHGPVPDAEAAPGLQGLELPHFSNTDALELAGESDGVIVLSGFVPRVDGAPRMSLALTVTAPSEAAVLASGVETQRTRQGASSVVTFAALGTNDATVVVTRDQLQRRSDVSGAALVGSYPASCGDASDAIFATARRAFEDAEAQWGRAAMSELRFVATTALGSQTLATASGFVFFSPSDCAQAAPKLKDDPVGAVIAHHPAAQDALTVAIASAVHRQWWLGRAADAPTRLLLEDAVPMVAALRTVEKLSGDKAMRRARVFGLELPYLDARGRSPLNPRDAASVGAEPVLTREPTELASRPKAGLFVDTLARHLGDTLYGDALRSLPARVTIDVLRKTLAAKAPRVSETDALIARWLDEAHADDDVEAPSLTTLFEYFAVDGLVTAGKGLLVDELAARPDLVGKGIDVLGNGVTPGMALQLLDDLTGEKNPEVQKWLDVAKGLLGEQRDQAIDSLVDELAREAGVPESERTRLRMMAGFAFKALLEPAVEGDDERAPDVDLTPTPKP